MNGQGSETAQPSEGTFVVISGVCSNCGRDRDDLFWHRQDETFYCLDVGRCDARFAILCRNGRRPVGRPEHLSGVRVYL